jgi:hypothetical protein
VNSVPLQILAVNEVFNTGVGLTVITKLDGVPEQPLAAGVTVMVPKIGPGVLLVVVKDGILPVPLAPKPMAVLLFVQLKVVPGTGPERVIANVTIAVQKRRSETALVVGIGKIVMIPEAET